MRIIQSCSFLKTLKRLYNNQKQYVDEAVHLIQKNPTIGQLKTADLAGLRVYKFRMLSQLSLLAYSYDDISDTLCLEALGSHENFYRDLKN